MKTKYLVIKNLKKTYELGEGEHIVALKNINLSIPKGEFVTIVGNNAGGKTTLLKLISGMIMPTAGEIYLDGILLSNMEETQRAKIISSVRQNPNDSLINSMTIAENLAMAKLKRSKIGLRVGMKKRWENEFISLLKPLGIGLEERLDDKIDSLSGGQKQIIALLMATLLKPKLLMLDEYTAALDPKVSKVILKITNEIINSNEITTLMITHNIYQAIEYGSRLILLQKGHVALDICGEEKKALSLHDLETYYNN